MPSGRGGVNVDRILAVAAMRRLHDGVSDYDPSFRQTKRDDLKLP
jgi:hypothetical protein